MADENPQPEAEDEATKSSLFPKILVSGFVGIVVIVETFIFFFLVPSADDVAALAEARLLSKVEESMQNDGEETLDNESETWEFKIGDFGVTFVPPGQDHKYQVEFPLSATIYTKDLKRVEELYSKKEARLRQGIMLEIRNSTTDDLMESQLGLIRRRILATTIDVLGEGEKDGTPEILGVSLASFQVIEE